MIEKKMNRAKTKELEEIEKLKIKEEVINEIKNKKEREVKLSEKKT